MSNSTPFTFAEWVPPAVIEAAEGLYNELGEEKDRAKALEVLSRLTSDPRMRLVWQELYRKKRNSDQAAAEFFTPACVTNASIAKALRQQADQERRQGGAINERDAQLLEAEAVIHQESGDPSADPRWSEQDRAVQLFLFHAYRTALDLKPIFLSDLQANVRKMRGVAEALRKQAATLQSLGMNGDAQKLNEIASDCDDEAWNIDPERHIAQNDDPWIITRQRGDVELRTFVTDLSIAMQMLFRKTLHGTLATVTNVVLDREDMTFEKVHDMIRPASRER